MPRNRYRITVTLDGDFVAIDVVVQSLLDALRDIGAPAMLRIETDDPPPDPRRNGTQ